MEITLKLEERGSKFNSIKTSSAQCKIRHFHNKLLLYWHALKKLFYHKIKKNKEEVYENYILK